MTKARSVDVTSFHAQQTSCMPLSPNANSCTTQQRLSAAVTVLSPIHALLFPFLLSPFHYNGRECPKPSCRCDRARLYDVPHHVVVEHVLEHARAEEEERHEEGEDKNQSKEDDHVALHSAYGYPA